MLFMFNKCPLQIQQDTLQGKFLAVSSDCGSRVLALLLARLDDACPFVSSVDNEGQGLSKCKKSP